MFSSAFVCVCVCPEDQCYFVFFSLKPYNLYKGVKLGQVDCTKHRYTANSKKVVLCKP